MKTALTARRALTLALSLALGTGLAQAAGLELNQALADDPDVVLQRLVLKAGHTEAHILVKNSTAEDHEVCLQPSGSPQAFTLTDLDSGKTWRVRQQSGLSTCTGKAWTRVAPGAQRQVTLRFPALPASVRRVSLGENDCKPSAESDDVDTWCFTDIPLK